jgi:hypothetical protein
VVEELLQECVFASECPEWVECDECEWECDEPCVGESSPIAMKASAASDPLESCVPDLEVDEDEVLDLDLLRFGYVASAYLWDEDGRAAGGVKGAEFLPALAAATDLLISLSAALAAAATMKPIVSITRKVPVSRKPTRNDAPAPTSARAAIIAHPLDASTTSSPVRDGAGSVLQQHPLGQTSAGASSSKR